jgi:hypothetical protein
MKKKRSHITKKNPPLDQSPQKRKPYAFYRDTKKKLKIKKPAHTQQALIPFAFGCFFSSVADRIFIFRWCSAGSIISVAAVVEGRNPVRGGKFRLEALNSFDVKFLFEGTSIAGFLVKKSAGFRWIWWTSTGLCLFRQCFFFFFFERIEWLVVLHDRKIYEKLADTLLN